MSNLFHPLLFAIARATDQQLARCVEYLKTENKILRARLPKRIVCTPAERATLVKLARPLGQAIKDNAAGKIVCESRLGGVIKSYRRAAA